MRFTCCYGSVNVVPPALRDCGDCMVDFLWRVLQLWVNTLVTHECATWSQHHGPMRVLHAVWEVTHGRRWTIVIQYLTSVQRIFGSAPMAHTTPVAARSLRRDRSHPPYTGMSRLSDFACLLLIDDSLRPSAWVQARAASVLGGTAANTVVADASSPWSKQHRSPVLESKVSHRSQSIWKI